jgi:hypothetical protein
LPEDGKPPRHVRGGEFVEPLIGPLFETSKLYSLPHLTVS